MQKKDRRVRRTQRKLKEVLISLLQTNKLSQITVKEICDKADINRSTFYLHYNNVYALWLSIEDEIISNMNRILETFDARSILTEPLPLLLDITKYIESENILTKKLFQCRESVILLEKVKICFIDYFINNTTTLIKPEDRVRMEMYSIFVISGAVSLYYSWFLGEIKISLNELAYAIEKLITGGVKEYISGFNTGIL